MSEWWTNRKRSKIGSRVNALFHLIPIGLCLALVASNRHIGVAMQRFNRAFWTESAFELEMVYQWMLVVVGVLLACAVFKRLVDFKLTAGLRNVGLLRMFSKIQKIWVVATIALAAVAAFAGPGYAQKRESVATENLRPTSQRIPSPRLSSGFDNPLEISRGAVQTLGSRRVIRLWIKRPASSRPMRRAIGGRR